MTRRWRDGIHLVLFKLYVVEITGFFGASTATPGKRRRGLGSSNSYQGFIYFQSDVDKVTDNQLYNRKGGVGKA